MKRVVVVHRWSWWGRGGVVVGAACALAAVGVDPIGPIRRLARHYRGEGK